MSEKPNNPQGTQSMPADREHAHGGSGLGAGIFAPCRTDVIRNLYTGEGFTVLEVADTGEPIIKTRSGKIRVPWSSYGKHYRNITAETFRANSQDQAPR